MYAREPTEILAYGQKILEQVCHGKQIKSLLEHLNDGVRESLDISEKLYKLCDEFMVSFWEREERGELSEKDYIKLADWLMLSWEFAYTGHESPRNESLWYEMGFVSAILKKKHKEWRPVINNYIDEIKRHVTDPHFRKWLEVLV